MLGLAINNEFLDLNPGTVLEIERQNPFLVFNDDITGEYSLPFEIKNTPKNIRLTKYAALLQQRVNTAGMDAIAYDGGIQDSVGKIKLEGTNHNLNRTQDGSVSCYYLTGSSSFYQDIKNAKLRDIDVGGDRTFNWDNFNRYGNGFWGHIHKVIDAAPGSYDYAFFPVINKSFGILQGNSELVNNMTFSNGVATFSGVTTDAKDINPICPFPYLKYVLLKAVDHVGWRIEGDILSDPDFAKIVLISFSAIVWVNGPFAAPTITFNLQDSLPDITIAQLLKGLANRFGWWLDFDRKAKVIRIKHLKNMVGTTVKDYTRSASPVIPKKISSEKVVYSLKNNFSGDYANGNPNLSNLVGTVNYISDLPAATDALYGKVYLVISENNYYICRTNDTGGYSWKFYSYNVFDVAPDGHNQDIPTDAVTIGNETYNGYLDFIPRMDAAGYVSVLDDLENSYTSLVLLFNHGMQSNKSGQLYPFASSGIYNSAGQQVANWSLAFQCKTFDGTQVGLYDLNWKTIMEAISGSETLTVTLNLSRIEYMKLNFGDIISIANTRMMVKKIKSSIPYSGKIDLECNRI